LVYNQNEESRQKAAHYIEMLDYMMGIGPKAWQEQAILRHTPEEKRPDSSTGEPADQRMDAMELDSEGRIEQPEEV
jgi:hypothetical protein